MTSVAKLRAIPCALVASLLLGTGPAGAQDQATPPVPRYELPAGLEIEKPPAPLAAAVRRAVAMLADPVTPELGQDAVRLVAGVGAPALPDAVAGIDGAPWPARAAILTAIAEMDAPGVTPLLVTATGDPSFAVREAAVVGLGKTGDARGVDALLRHVTPDDEPAWRVRVATATAVRRAVLRGHLSRDRGATALLTLLDDPDRDVRLTALAELAPLASERALPELLRLFGLLVAERNAPAEEQKRVLAALRAYRVDAPGLTDALREGFLTAEPDDAVDAGRALFELEGVVALDHEEVADRSLQLLMESSSHWKMRSALRSLGKGAAPWLRERAEWLALRLAAGRAEGHLDQLEALVDVLIQVDEEEGIALLRSFLSGKNAEVLDPHTRRIALDRAARAFAKRLGPELRQLFRAGAGRDLRGQILRAIVTSGGDDVGQILAGALESEESGVVRAALDELGRRLDFTAPPRLVELARNAPSPSLRRHAMDTLRRRDLAKALEIAAAAVNDRRSSIRETAYAILREKRDDANFELLLGRLEKEGAPPPAEDPPSPPVPEGDDGRPLEPGRGTAGAVTTPGRARGSKARRDLVRAIRGAGGERARPVLMKLILDDPDAEMRQTAAEQLSGLARSADARILRDRVGNEPDLRVQKALRDLLAGLPDSPTAVAYFDRLLGDPNQRESALRSLLNTKSPGVPERLVSGAMDASWTEQDRASALVVLERAGRVPDAAALAALVEESQTLGIVDEAVRLLAAHGGERARPLLLKLLDSLDDQDKLTLVVQELGRQRATAATPAVLGHFERTRERAMTAVVKTDPALELYAKCAVALGRLGGEAAGRALVRHLLHEDVVRAGARLSALRNGPFKPQESAPVRVIQLLVRALGQFDDATLSRLLSEELARRAPEGRDLMLDEGYVDGIARYLRDPAAYILPPRRRPAAALVLRRLVPRIAPRLSPLDAEALEQMSGELASQRRFGEAAAARRRAVVIRNIEDAARDEETRVWETGKLRVLDARALAARGKTEEALTLLASLREPDPSSDDLAELQGLGFVKIGRAGAASRDALLFAIGQNPKLAGRTFYLAWTVEVMEGVGAALAHYDRARELDRKKVEDAQGEYLTHRRGKVHRWAHYSYYQARALARLGHHDEARHALREAIRNDDREAAKALADPAFSGLEDLREVVADALSRLPD